MTKTEALNIRIDPKIKEELRKQAKDYGVSMSEYVAELVRMHSPRVSVRHR